MILGVQIIGSFKRLCMTSYRSSIDTVDLSCLERIRWSCFGNSGSCLQRTLDRDCRQAEEPKQLVDEASRFHLGRHSPAPTLCGHLLWRWGRGLGSSPLPRNFFEFLSRVSILTRDIDIANLYVRFSVCPLRSGTDENGLTYRHSFFHHTVAQSLTSIKQFRRGHPRRRR